MSSKKDRFSSQDKNYMKLAINLARSRKGLTGDNPSVGCLIVKNDEIISVFVHSHHEHQHKIRQKFGIKTPINISHLVCF